MAEALQPSLPISADEASASINAGQCVRAWNRLPTSNFLSGRSPSKSPWTPTAAARAQRGWRRRREANLRRLRRQKRVFWRRVRSLPYPGNRLLLSYLRSFVNILSFWVCFIAESPAEFFAENKNIAGFDNVSFLPNSIAVIYWFQLRPI